IGSLTGEAFIEGKGFDPQTALVNIDARLSQFQMNGYHYKNIVANGNLARRQFIGDINIKDPNLTAVFDGFLDFRDKNLIITAKSDIAHADVQQLKLFNQNVKLSGKFDMDFTGTNVDNFLGYAKLHDLKILKDEQPLNLDSLMINSYYEPNGEKR